jgi:WD40 repeat protein
MSASCVVPAKGGGVGMYFSETTPDSTFVRWSPCGTMIASFRPSDKMVLVHSCENPEVLIRHPMEAKLDALEWSPDGQMLMAGMYSKKRMLQVLAVDKSREFCTTIDGGPAGIDGVQWSPDSRHLVVATEFNIRLNIWSLDADR